MGQAEQCTRERGACREWREGFGWLEGWKDRGVAKWEDTRQKGELKFRGSEVPVTAWLDTGPFHRIISKGSATRH
jgi:hypothetical protein